MEQDDVLPFGVLHKVFARLGGQEGDTAKIGVAFSFFLSHRGPVPLI